MGRNIENELCTRPSAFNNFNALRQSNRQSLHAIEAAKQTPSEDLLAQARTLYEENKKSRIRKNRRSTNTNIEKRITHVTTLGELAPELELFSARIEQQQNSPYLHS